MPSLTSRTPWFMAFLMTGLMAIGAVGDDATGEAPAETISYYKQIQPIFQANCQGCHQPAKAGGAYVMTTFDALLKGGEMGVEAIVPGKPEESYLVDQIEVHDGKAAMPQDKPPLAAKDIELISTWIAQGAANDTPVNAIARYDVDHPPVYTRPPVLAALDVSPDGELLAVAGFHEVLLWKADGSELVGRLIGLAERIQSVAFSPDGARLAVTGGLPGRVGEVQVWNVAERKLDLSVPVTYDTVYGASWSPDGSLVAFGCGDNSVRAIDARTGEQVLFMGSHDDWALDTTFSKDGAHLVSVGRDMAVKLTEVATERFVDNITSITPGALKGGVQAVARHPERDEIVIGGSDGIPKVYRFFRLVTRVIGDDSNIIRELPGMPGRVNAVAVSRDGTRIAAASSHDGTGKVHVYSYEFDTELPDDIKAIMAKVSTSRSADEAARLDEYIRKDVKLIASTDIPEAGQYALAFRLDGTVVAAGADGVVRLINPETGAVASSFAPAPLGGTPPEIPNEVAVTEVADSTTSASMEESLPEGANLTAMRVVPEAIRLGGVFEYAQVVVLGTLDTGDTVDVTRLVQADLTEPIAAITSYGFVTPKVDGSASLRLSLRDKSVVVPVEVRGMDVEPTVNFVTDVNPALSRLGCNQGTCHGAQAGKNGFKLSLRGYDPIFDVRALTDDHASRRVNIASPDDSLMLLKSTGAVPHVGSQLTKPGEAYYDTIRNWIAAGATLDLSAPRVVGIEVFPLNPIIQQIGSNQQLRVLATYADGRVRDVTREAFLESGDTEVARPIESHNGLLTSLRRGEAPVLVRFEGAYASTTLTVMGDRAGFVWEEPPAYNQIDELVARKWERMKILPSDVSTDAEFLRRASIDLTGLPPTPEAVRAFLADERDSRIKRSELVDRLIGNDDFVDHWANKWADLLQVNRKFLGVEGATGFRTWIREQVAQNTPYDQFVRSIITASGSNRENPAAAYYKILRTPEDTMENTTQLFLAVRFNCNKCHDHPFERWTQDQYYQTSAYFARFGLEPDPESQGKTIGGTAVEDAKPLYEIVKEKDSGDVIHDRTKEITPPEFPYDSTFEVPAEASRREELASWLTAPDNPYFARSYVNRLWGYLFGVGIIEPLDDIRAGNPPTNPELLDYLTQEFVQSGFDTRHVIKLIANSRTYQLSVESNRWNEDDAINFSHAIPKRLPAEVLLDAVYRVTGSASNFPGIPPGTRAAALPDVGVELPSGFLSTFGRPARESSCECERSDDLQLGPIMALVSGPTLAEAIADPSNALTQAVNREVDDAALVNELFLRILNRPATEPEIEACLSSFRLVDDDHQQLAAALGAREAEFALKRPLLEREREAGIAKAQAELAAYEAELAPKLAEQERARAERITQAEADLNAYEQDGLLVKLAEWEKAQSTEVRWRVLDPSSVQASNGNTLVQEPDGSVVVTEGDAKNGVITLVAETDLTGITGVRLEMIADDRLPNRGPGRAPDGNFVLNEFQLKAAPKANPDQAANVKFQNPLADFSQEGLEVAKAIDGDRQAGSGWALSPVTGHTHWATFETAQPVGHEGGAVLTFQLVHNYENVYMPGRFRISVTTLAAPVGLSLAEEYRAILATVPELRTTSQSDTLRSYFRSVDGDWRTKSNAVNQAKAPLPEDARLVALKKAAEEAKNAVPVDPVLARLRNDIEQSIQQAASQRLTVAQDIAWALINSPAFLFNH